ncbi:MAG: hypothetical protein AUJ74_07275 [Candidatus Omnitrophica bacterium CG1_02_44_16]|nr:MAG: hypothetical protein AUJ74_07275 [Candidatus Omnitrophica bacterium CG1_02_44_16]PIY82292.1 MAG: hypothetical protein COY78_07600 [Candidatus Omnitrophica bacterium CG_4_10_14_0_8_um_filter_44_12]PIZ84586.1 MAG: hypothetical protein COX96_03035 [Candidatus Omnitrophica bacterium CG_4_10_14_0_2_um_filter_44_9]
MKDSEASGYKLEQGGAFVINNYNFTRPWSSFFPGIAGLFGIPIWAFYVNRGQCIASVGIHSKDEAIMEFLPANKAYQLTPSQGFRTFIKLRDNKKSIFYEPFSPREGALSRSTKNKMVIRAFDLKLVEEQASLGLEVEVSYFSIPAAPYAALARELVIKNTSRGLKHLEFLDGLSVIVPCGVNNWFLKEMSRTIEAWMTVEMQAKGVPIYRLTTDPCDTAQVAFVKGANFYVGFQEDKDCSQTKVIVDPAAVFAEASDFSLPLNFIKSGVFRYPKGLAAENKFPCGFSYCDTELKPGAEVRFYSMIGHVFDVIDIKKHGIAKIDKDFMRDKRLLNQLLIEGIMDKAFTASSIPEFDLYVRQTYLDNVLRGGLPYSFDIDGVKKSVYAFSRKHGDLERDYNRFSVPATYFSQGDGNYRDVNQNRRSDIFFEPLLGDKNIVDFMDLIQLDGYNPLIFKGDRFVISQEAFSQRARASRPSGALSFTEKDSKKIAAIVSKPFTIGEIFQYIRVNNILLPCSCEQFARELITLSSSSEEAAFGEGYWSDHWTYNIDLLESFISVYPDRAKELLFEKKIFTYFDTHVFVKPRAERYTVQRGEMRQYRSIFLDEEKNALISRRHEAKNKVRMHFGEGDIFKTTLVDKLLTLILNKLSTLDPFGAGIEMEADKPGWYDALNGLPGLFGSSASEAFELKRLILLLRGLFLKWGVEADKQVAVIVEAVEFFEGLLGLLATDASDLEYWDKANSLKESYRLRVRRGVSGDLKDIPVSKIQELFDLALIKLNLAIAKSFDAKTGCYCTYFYHKAVRRGPSDIEFTQERLPLFLEGFVHAMRTEKNKASSIHKALKKSPLWDKKLKMYKVNASLDSESFEIGRAKAFVPGWLENGSIWLHMEYKYIVELLKNGLYDEFYEDFFQVLVPFQKPSVYGRSILENSSFIVSSIHPDKSLHGAGFVARLSGSTAEFIHMWLLMNVGSEPFFLDNDGALSLRFKPALCGKLFASGPGTAERAKRGAPEYSFLFLGKTRVTYINPKGKDTFGKGGVGPARIRLFGPEGLIAEAEGGVVRSPYAEMVRSGVVERIECVLGKI